MAFRDTNPFMEGCPNILWVVDTVNEKDDWGSTKTRTFTTERGLLTALKKYEVRSVTQVICRYQTLNVDALQARLEAKNGTR